MSVWLFVCLHSNSNRTEDIKSKLGAGLVLGKDWKPIYFGPKRSKVKVTGSKKVKILLLLLYASLFKLGSKFLQGILLPLVHILYAWWPSSDLDLEER